VFQLLKSLVNQRLLNSEWLEKTEVDGLLLVLVCLRMLLRDTVFQREFFTVGGVKGTVEMLTSLTSVYLAGQDKPFLIEQLKELTNICQKLTSDASKREWLVGCGVHKVL
jgi:hypothetical protein